MAKLGHHLLKPRAWVGNLGLSALSILLTILVSVGVDRGFGLAIFGTGAAGDHNRTGLISVPNAKVLYRTDEFSFIATTNSLGFRDAEPDLNRRPAFRIVAIGDSFTYGWGVGDRDPWPRLLAHNLRERLGDVEVVNLGWPGTTPSDYADIAERAIPLLKPDLVILAVLQGEDFAQTWYEARPLGSRLEHLTIGRIPALLWGKLADWSRSGVRRAYPNIVAYLERSSTAAPADAPVEVSVSWPEMARRIESDFTAEERLRFDRLGADIRSAFRRGGLNPTLISRAVKARDYYRLTEKYETPQGRRVVEALAERLVRIRAVAQEHNARIMVVSVPFGLYVNRPAWESIQTLGYEVDRGMLSSGAPDEAIRIAALRAGAAYAGVTDGFRARSNDPSLYFPLDTHFTAAGHRLFADLLTPLVVARKSS